MLDNLPDYESTGGCQPYSQLIGLDRALTWTKTKNQHKASVFNKTQKLQESQINKPFPLLVNILQLLISEWNTLEIVTLKWHHVTFSQQRAPQTPSSSALFAYK